MSIVEDLLLRLGLIGTHMRKSLSKEGKQILLCKFLADLTKMNPTYEQLKNEIEVLASDLSSLRKI